MRSSSGPVCITGGHARRPAYPGARGCRPRSTDRPPRRRRGSLCAEDLDADDKVARTAVRTAPTTLGPPASEIIRRRDRRPDWPLRCPPHDTTTPGGTRRIGPVQRTPSTPLPGHFFGASEGRRDYQLPRSPMPQVLHTRPITELSSAAHQPTTTSPSVPRSPRPRPLCHPQDVPDVPDSLNSITFCFTRVAPEVQRPHIDGRATGSMMVV